MELIWDEGEEVILAELTAVRRSCVEIDGDPVAVGLGVNIRVYDDRVFDEAGKRMIGQVIGREKPCESRHIAKHAVDLEHVHYSEIGRDVPQPMYLDASVKLLVEEASHRLAESLVEFEFDADVAVVGETGVPSEAQTSGLKSKMSMNDPFMN